VDFLQFSREIGTVEELKHLSEFLQQKSIWFIIEVGLICFQSFNTDPTVRHTFWTVCVAGSWYWMICNTNQSVIQRYLTLKNQKTARKGNIIYVVGLIILIGMCFYNGLLLYATYHDCDPLTTKLAKAKDQLIPLLVMKILKDIPGLPGLFIAGVFSAALSSLSSALNSMSAVVLEDYFKPFFKNGISERTSAIIMRGTVLILGIVSVLLVYVVQHLGQVLQLSMSLPAMFQGSIFGIFMIGMFVPWIGKHATFFGALIATAVMCYVVIRAQIDNGKGLIYHETKITSVEGCTYNFTLAVNATNVNSTIYHEKQFHNISYLYYMPMGAIITMMSAFILSLIFGFEDPSNVDPQLLAPMIRKYFKSQVEQSVVTRDDGTDVIMTKFEITKNQLE
jgi:solute carrier family 5 (sodium-coupled monocarboxylate transporter), member 8/12